MEFIKDHSYLFPLIIALIVTPIGFLIKHFFFSNFRNSEKGTQRDAHTEDKKLGKLFLAQFPSNGKSCGFLRDHDIKVPFYESELVEILDFNATWNNAEHEFINPKLEKMRKELLEKTMKFDAKLARYVRMDEHNRYTTKLKYADMAEDAVLAKERKAMEELNTMAIDAFECHEELTREIRKLL